MKIKSQSFRPRGQRAPRARISKLRIKLARMNRKAAKVSGGKSVKPSLMKSQVEPQIPHRISQTIRVFMRDLCAPGWDCAIRATGRAGGCGRLIGKGA